MVRRVQQHGKGSGVGKRTMIRQGQEVGEKRNERTARGEALIANDRKVASEDYDLSQFHPTMKQKFIMGNIYKLPIVIVDGVAGTGKTTVSIRKGLELLKSGKINQIIFVKTPSESGDDKLGYLKGGEEEKLESHFEAMRSVFYTFMSPEKLKAEEAAGRILFTVPNFLQGKTFNRCLIIVDETQNISPPTVKLITERSGQSTSVVLLGDSTQQYAHDHREDGFKDFIRRTTLVQDNVRKPKREAFVAYHKLCKKDIKRSELAEYISEIYQDWVVETEITDVWSSYMGELGYGGVGLEDEVT